MYAYFFFSNRRRLTFWREEILGLPLLRIELPQRITPRVCRRTERGMKHFRVHQLFNHPEDWPGEALPPLNPTRPLWEEMAAETALFLLEREGVAPSCATVEICARQFSPCARSAILTLLPQVRSLSLSLPAPEQFLWQLQHDYGVSPRSGPGHLAVCFCPAQRSRMLPLWEDRPQIPGAALSADLDEMPEGCPQLPLLAALANQGRLGREQIQICSDFS